MCKNKLWMTEPLHFVKKHALACPIAPAHRCVTHPRAKVEVTTQALAALEAVRWLKDDVGGLSSVGAGHLVEMQGT